MATELKTITKLAKELAAKELENDSTVDQKPPSFSGCCGR